MKRIILDTNFLIDIMRFKIDIEEIKGIIDGPYRILTISPVIDELKKIAKKKTKESKNAKIVLKLIKSKRIEVLKSKGKYTDDVILNLVDKNTIVATNDKKLRKKLKRLGTKTIYLRAKKYLAIS